MSPIIPRNTPNTNPIPAPVTRKQGEHSMSLGRRTSWELRKQRLRRVTNMQPKSVAGTRVYSILTSVGSVRYIYRRPWRFDVRIILLLSVVSCSTGYLRRHDKRSPGAGEKDAIWTRHTPKCNPSRTIPQAGNSPQQNDLTPTRPSRPECVSNKDRGVIARGASTKAQGHAGNFRSTSNGSHDELEAARIHGIRWRSLCIGCTRRRFGHPNLEPREAALRFPGRSCKCRRHHR